MDLESECSALESVEDNELTPERMSHVNEIKVVENNGSCANDVDDLNTVDHLHSKTLASDMKGNDVKTEQPVNSPPMTAKSPGISGGSPPATTKGYGLKKWRRIRRDFVKDTSATLESSKILKRGLSITKPLHLSVEARQKSEGSVGSANASVKDLGGADYFAIHGSSSDSRLAPGSTFVAGTDFENSDDQSSKSSTAASVPKAKFDMPALLGNARDKNRVKNLSGKILGNSVQRVQQGKGRIETSKKPRGERVKVEKENSHSSMESDARSSNFVFMQGNISAISNGRHSGKSSNCDGENSDEAQVSEQLLNEEIQTGYSKEDVGEIEDVSPNDLNAELSWEAKEGKSENHQTSSDPLVESIQMLQSVQEALEKEVQKFREIGKDTTLLKDNSTKGSHLATDSTSSDPENQPSASYQLSSEEIRQNASISLEMQVIRLTQQVNLLESKLEEARTMLEVKESRVVELESTLNNSKLLKEKSGRTEGETETELECLFKRKIEAEVEYLTIIRTIRNLKIAAGDQNMLFEEQKALIGEQVHMLNKLEEAESKATMLKKQAEELETYCGNILGTEDVLKMQKRVCKITSCFFIQLVLLVVVFGLFVLQLSPNSAEFVPT